VQGAVASPGEAPLPGQAVAPETGDPAAFVAEHGWLVQAHQQMVTGATGTVDQMRPDVLLERQAVDRQALVEEQGGLET